MWGDVILHSELEKRLPEGIAFDSQVMTRHPSAVLDGGGVVPFGEHKGYGLSFAAQALGLLAGAALASGNVQYYGFLLLVLDPELLPPKGDFPAQMAGSLRRLRQLRGVPESKKSASHQSARIASASSGAARACARPHGGRGARRVIARKESYDETQPTADDARGRVAVRGDRLGTAYLTWPARIVTSGIGGSADYVSRLPAQGLTDTWGQQVIVDNRANGPVPGEIVSGAAPDGDNLVVSANSLWIGQLLQAQPYHPIRDFTPITLATRSPNVLWVNPTLPANSVKDLIAMAKAKPGQLNYGSGATGASSHLAAELLKAMAGVNIVRIPDKSNSAQITDLMAGQIQLMFSNATAAPPHMNRGA